jgi:hypothetical protein
MLSRTDRRKPSSSAVLPVFPLASGRPPVRSRTLASGSAFGSLAQAHISGQECTGSFECILSM